MRRHVLVPLLLAVFLLPLGLAAQDAAPPAPAPTPAAGGAPPEKEKDEPIPYRPIEGPVIINLPSTEVPKRGTLTVLFAHRFRTQVQGSSINDLFSLDDGANIGIGLGYAPIDKLSVYFYRYSNDNKTYEASAKYSLWSKGPFAIALGAGGDFRTVPDPEPPFPPVQNRSSFFAQAMLAYTPFPWLRLTAEPMYLNHTSGQPAYGVGVAGVPGFFSVQPEPFYSNVFNVPVAASVAITRSITLHAEVMPSFGRNVQVTSFDCPVPPLPIGPCPTVSAHSSPGVGWVVSVEKTLLRHRFAFMAGNMTETTVDQLLLPNFSGKPKNIYVGFYLSRQWPLIK